MNQSVFNVKTHSVLEKFKYWIKKLWEVIVVAVVTVELQYQDRLGACVCVRSEASQSSSREFIFTLKAKPRFEVSAASKE